jgi:class 3 adenylate cyclase/YHS domain-containing protein
VSGLVEPAILYFHRRGVLRAVRDDLALHLAEDVGLLPPDDETGRLFAAVHFIDLARFTALTDAMGDAAAADVLNRFSDLVRRCALSHDGRIVKQIGDEFMLVFGDPRSALECALDIRAAALAEPQFLGTRQGIHWGPVLYREGDYYGGTVNIAARIVAEAVADRVLVSGPLRDEAGQPDDVEFVAMGRRRVKHVAEPVDLYEVRRPGDDAGLDRTVDPVCGMAVDPSSPAVRLEMDGQDLVFCSQPCLQRFVAHPERYRASPARHIPSRPGLVYVPATPRRPPRASRRRGTSERPSRRRHPTR